MRFREILEEVLLAYSTDRIKTEDFKPHPKTDIRKYQESLNSLLSENKDAKIIIDMSMLSPLTIKSSVELSPRVYLRDLSLLRAVNHLHTRGYDHKFNEILHDIRGKVRDWYAELFNFLKNPQVLTVSETTEEMYKFIDIRKEKNMHLNNGNRTNPSSELNQLNALRNSLDMIRNERRILGKNYLEKRGRSINKVVKSIVRNGTELYNESRDSQYQINKSSRLLVTKAIAKSIRTKEKIIILSNTSRIRDLVKLIDFSLPKKNPEQTAENNRHMMCDAQVAACKPIFDEMCNYKIELGGQINFVPTTTVPRKRK